MSNLFSPGSLRPRRDRALLGRPGGKHRGDRVMRNLCSAHWFHLLRHKAFWVSVLFMALYGGMEAVGLYRQGAEKLSDGLFAGTDLSGGGSGGPFAASIWAQSTRMAH